jgi:hypothetical protein
MTNKDNDTLHAAPQGANPSSVPSGQGPEVSVGPVAAAAALASQETHITNIVNVTVAGAPTARRHHPPAKGSNPVATSTHRPTSPPGPTPVHATRNQPTAATSLTASGGHHYIDNYNGNERHTLIDSDGSSVVVISNRETADTTLHFKDRAAEFTTNSEKAGFSGYREVPYGFGGTKPYRMEVSEGKLFDGASIHCADDVPILSWRGIDLDTASTTNRRAGELTAREVQEFMRRNPELGAELRGMRFSDGRPVPVTEVAGQTLTAGALNQLKAPPTVACPAGKDDEYIGRVRGK